MLILNIFLQILFDVGLSILDLHFEKLNCMTYKLWLQWFILSIFCCLWIENNFFVLQIALPLELFFLFKFKCLIVGMKWGYKKLAPERKKFSKKDKRKGKLSHIKRTWQEDHITERLSHRKMAYQTDNITRTTSGRQPYRKMI